MKQLKKFLSRVLSQAAYLRTMHRGFYFLYDLGFLKNDARFKYHYMVKKLIQPDFVVVDIGANLGYFAKNFARLTPKGKVIAIEPVPMFYAVLKQFLGKFKQVEIHNVALGKEEGTITMVMPESDGFIRTGLPHIASSEEEKKQHKTQDVRIVKAADFFSKIDKINYIKCDIEGYEGVVFTEIKGALAQHRPFVQLEVSDSTKETIFSIFKELDYLHFGIQNFKFMEENYGPQKEEGDYFFVPREKMDLFHQYINA